ncbi:hypothetical protein JYT87_00695 [Nitrospira defluvii]|nr:hypothetical protein [Nitrospira defluvii]
MYAEMTINQCVSQSKQLLNKLNETPTFWITVTASLQSSAYISFGRVFERKSKYNIEMLIRSAESNLDAFGEAALAERKREGKKANPPWLAKYLEDAYYPTAKDFKHLQKKIEKHRNIYLNGIKPARDEYLAHRVKEEHSEVQELFARLKNKDVWKLSSFLYQLHEVLWQLYNNGKKPRFKPIRYSIPSMVKNPPTGDAPQERILRETIELMKGLS